MSIHGDKDHFADFSSALAVMSVFAFVFSTAIICFCAYCVDFTKVIQLCCPKTKKYAVSAETSHVFTNHFNEAFIGQQSVPIPVEINPPIWRNAVVVGTLPYRKLTTISRYGTSTTDNELEMLRIKKNSIACV